MSNREEQIKTIDVDGKVNGYVLVIVALLTTIAVAMGYLWMRERKLRRRDQIDAIRLAEENRRGLINAVRMTMFSPDDQPETSPPRDMPSQGEDKPDPPLTPKMQAAP